MFSDDQQQKIYVFSSLAKLTNVCFNQCVMSFNNSSAYLTEEEIECVTKCSSSYLNLRKNIKNQLYKDLEEIKEKNKYIYENKT